MDSTPTHETPEPTAPVDPRNDPAKRQDGCPGGSWCRCDVSTPCWPFR